MVGEWVFTIALGHISESLANVRKREGHTHSPNIETYAEVATTTQVGPYEVLEDKGGCTLSGVVTIVFSAFVELNEAEVEKARKELEENGKIVDRQKHRRN